MRAAKVQASLRIRAVSPEPPLLAHTSSESRGTFRQKASSLVPLNGWACAVKICHDGMLEDTNSLDGAHIVVKIWKRVKTVWINMEDTNNKVFYCQIKKHRWKGNDQEPIQSNSTSYPRHQMGKGHILVRRHKIKTARVESQEDSFFPEDCHQAILDKMNKLSKTNRKRTNIDNN